MLPLCGSLSIHNNEVFVHIMPCELCVCVCVCTWVSLCARMHVLCVYAYLRFLKLPTFFPQIWSCAAAIQTIQY